MRFERSGFGTGSGRSIAGVDLGRTVRRAVADGLLQKGGGHAMAAGITVKHERLGNFAPIWKANSPHRFRSRDPDQSLLIDGAVSASGANLALISTLAQAGPFGAGNPRPVIALPSHTVAYAEPVGPARNARPKLRSGDGVMINAIAFRAMNQPLGQALLASRGQAVHAAGTLTVDRWNGNERVQLRLRNARGSWCRSPSC